MRHTLSPRHLAATTLCVFLVAFPLLPGQTSTPVRPQAAPTLLNWQEFISKEGAFRVEVPGTLRREVEPGQTKDDPTLYRFTLVTNTAVYLIQYFEVPQLDQIPEMRRQQLFEESVKRFVNAVGGRLLSQQTVQLDGVTGREVVIGADGKFSRSRIYMARSRIYVVTIGALSEADLASTGERFLNSFKLL